MKPDLDPDMARHVADALVVLAAVVGVLILIAWLAG